MYTVIIINFLKIFFASLSIRMSKNSIKSDDKKIKKATFTKIKKYLV